MKVYSTLLGKKHSVDWQNELSSASFFPETGKVRDVSIISAYTDLAMLNIICKQAFNKSDKRTPVRIRIFLDRLASTYENDSKMKRRIDLLSKKIQNKGAKDSGIYLVKIGSLFHAKAVVVETNADIVCMVGSLNMTKKAFARNEELVLLGQADSGSKASTAQIAKWISGEYCEKLESNSIKVPFTDEIIFQDSLQSLMLSGRMFHEVKEADPFRFNIGLPADFLKIKQSIHPLLKAELRDSISIESIILGLQQEDGIERVLPKASEDGSRERWKKYCLETCYGYWCPDSLRNDAEKAKESRRQSRLPKFEGSDQCEGLFSIIKNNREDITICFYEILRKLNAQIVAGGITDAKWNVEKVRARWTTWYDLLIDKLKNQDIRDRIISGVHSTPVPNVWSDPITSKEFESSFMEGLQFAFSKGEVTQFKKVIKTLKDSYQLDADIIRDGKLTEILQHLEERINVTSKEDDPDFLNDVD